MDHFGLTISSYIDNQGWRQCDLESTSLVNVTNCWCCHAPLRTQCAVKSMSGKYMRIGQCEQCGYVGYMDRPNAAWFTHFYNTTWDRQQEKTIEDVKEFGTNKLIDIAISSGISMNESVFEIGAGYGQLLKQFENAGFKRLYGIEHSPHRATLASQFAHAQIFHGEFGTESALSETLRRAPYGLVFSKSVMEHVYNPRSFIIDTATIQKDGGYLFISVPNLLEEPTVTTLLFLPHLHAFTCTSLIHLAKNNGYIPRKVVHHGKGIILIAQKGAINQFQAQCTNGNPCTHAHIASNKWIPELKLRELKEESQHIYWWSPADTNKTGVFRLASNLKFINIMIPILKFITTHKIPSLFMRVLFRVPLRRKIFLYAISKTTRSPHDVPIDVSLPSLKLFYK